MIAHSINLPKSETKFYLFGFEITLLFCLFVFVGFWTQEKKLKQTKQVTIVWKRVEQTRHSTTLVSKYDVNASVRKKSRKWTNKQTNSAPLVHDAADGRAVSVKLVSVLWFLFSSILHLEQTDFCVNYVWMLKIHWASAEPTVDCLYFIFRLCAKNYDDRCNAIRMCCCCCFDCCVCVCVCLALTFAMFSSVCCVCC